MSDDQKPPLERDIRFWAVVFVIWICLLLGFMNIQTKISMLMGIIGNEQAKSSLNYAEAFFIASGVARIIETLDMRAA